MKTVIYARFSSDMQRAASCEDQVRKVRQHLDHLGIDHRNAIVIEDKATSGTNETREGYARIAEMIKKGEKFILAVDDQSRLSRNMAVGSFIQDLVFNCGRFISADGVDTTQNGWELLVAIHGIKNNAYLKDLALKVRRGQEGRVLDGNGSAGDLAFGYDSRFVDPEAESSTKRRGPKPKVELIINEDAAKWVIRAFEWLVEGKSIGWITREFTRLAVPKGPRSTVKAWHHHEIRRMLSNEKYIGKWTWGKTMTTRDSSGKKRQVPAPQDKIISCDRPSLRVVPQALWDAAQERLKQLSAIYGQKNDQNPRGPKKHYTETYPKSLLGGLLYCKICGGRLVYQTGGSDTYYGCSAHRKGCCSQTTRAPKEETEKALIGLLQNPLSANAEWLAEVRKRISIRIGELANRVPREEAEAERRADKLRKEIDNLTDAIKDGGANSKALTKSLAQSEEFLSETEVKLAELRAINPRNITMPDDAWIARELANLQVILQEGGTQAALLLREAFGKVMVSEVVLPGKKRGYVELHVRVKGMSIFKHIATKAGLPELLFTNDDTWSDEIVIPVGKQSRYDVLTPEIVEMRRQGMSIRDIDKRVGLGTGNVWTILNRNNALGNGGAALIA